MATKKNTAAKATSKSQEHRLPSVSVRIDKMLDSSVSSTRAFASANIGGAYAIHGIRVIDSQKGLFVSMPQNSYTAENGETRYSDVFHPITAQARTELYDKDAGSLRAETGRGPGAGRRRRGLRGSRPGDGAKYVTFCGKFRFGLDFSDSAGIVEMKGW